MILNNPSQTWTEEEVYEEVKSSIAAVRQRLQDLAEGGYITGKPAFLLGAGPWLPVLQEIKEQYALRRVRVIELN